MPSLILVAGEQTRWEKDHPVRFKQLLPVCGEPVLHRIVRQVRSRHSYPTIVTHREELWHCNASHYMPRHRRWTVETLLWTVGLWGDISRTHILLGDTAYSRTIMDRIFHCSDYIRVFGNEYEIYAISFDPTAITEMVFNLLLANEHASDGGAGKTGKLRVLYELLCGFKIGCGAIEENVLDRVCYIQDYTKDFDTPNDYANFLNRWERKGLVDDLP